MSALTTVIEVQFDDAQATTYLPRRVIKQAVLVPIPDGVETTIIPSWGGEQKFVGSWYAIYEDGKVKYGSACKEFDETHEKTGDGENTYVKVTPIRAYRYRGEPARVVTRLADGTVETENIASDGDWLAQWPHGEVGVLKDEEIRPLYDIK